MVALGRDRGQGLSGMRKKVEIAQERQKVKQ